MLVRRYVNLSELLDPLLREMAEGHAWVPFSGAAPDPGTPILIRHEVARLNLVLDFGAVAELSPVDRGHGSSYRCNCLDI